jgi:hypothetical protein
MTRPLPSAALLTCVLSACGGGGGGGPKPPANVEARLDAPSLDLGPATTAAELAVALAFGGAAPSLLEVAVELPPALVVAEGEPLLAAQPVHTLRGGSHDNHYRIVCGDAATRDGAPLAAGPLFRLRLATATPRQVGTFELVLRDLRAVASDGSAVAAATQPRVVTVTVR